MNFQHLAYWQDKAKNLAIETRLFINGEYCAAADNTTFETIDPAAQQTLAQVARGKKADVERAVKAARQAFDNGDWSQASPAQRKAILTRFADLMEAHREELALLETLDTGKPIRHSLRDDIPGAARAIRWYAEALDKVYGEVAPTGSNELAMIVREPIGVIAAVVPWNFPLLMAAWKLAPALAAGNCVVLKPAEQTPLSITLLLELIGDLFPAGVLNVVQGFGKEAGEALATSKRIAKLAFTGSTPVGRHILACAAENIIPCTVELGGKSPNIYFADVMDGEEEFIEKAVEGLVLGFFNQGEVCTCPSRALIHESIYEPFMARVMEKVAQIRRGDPLDTDTMIGAQASRQQFDKILSYIQIAREEGGQILTGGERAAIAPALDNGFYIQPTLIKGRNDMRSFQEEIFGPVIGVTTFKDEAEALAIANETQFGLGAGVWTRDTNLAYRMGRGIKAGRVWTNCYHVYPAHAAFGGYKQSGVGRETHKMALDAYQQTKNLLVSYGTAPLGLF